MKRNPVFVTLALLAFLVLLPASLRAGVGVWTSHGPVKPDGSAPFIDALAIDPRAPATVYAGAGDGSSNSGGGDSGVFRSTDGGVTWTYTSHRLDNLLVSFLAIDPSSNLYAGTTSFDDPTGLFQSTDGGITWRVILGTDDVIALAIDPSAPSTLYASAIFNGVLKSVNGGTSWTPLPLGLTETAVNALAIDPSSPSTIYAGTQDYTARTGGVLKSVNGGQTWSAANTGLPNKPVFVLAIDPIIPATLYAGTSGGLFKSVDGGRSWTAASTGLTNMSVRALVIDSSAPATLYAGTAGGGVFKSANGGASWEAMSAGLANLYVNALAIDPSNPARLYAGTDGGVYEFQAAAGLCAPDATTLCVNGGRFRVTAQWSTRDGRSGAGQAVALSGIAGYFTFFDPSNVEIVIKVLNGCAFNSRFWTFAAGLTDVGVILTVTDTQTGFIQTYTNSQGTPFKTIQDTNAFATCP
jgi:photosystem II stability/assembly factor-like uncharacterized protein